MQRSEKQRQASRDNGKKSRGPVTPTGKGTSKFNGLKHGLRAEHVVLPGEDPAEFEAERRAWIDDWRPISHTRAVLVERAAVASWRLRRAVRAESAWLGERADAAGHASDFDRLNRVERAVDQAAHDPGGAMSLLLCDAAGIDRLIAACDELERALQAGPSGWSRPIYHVRLMMLVGRRLDENPTYAGGVPRASARLLAANDAEYAAKPGLGYCEVISPLPEDEHEAAVETLRRAVAEQAAGLRERRRGMPDPADLRRRAVEAAYTDGTEEGKLRHRYEMAHDRALRATIGQLMALERSGADLAGAEEAVDSEVSSDKDVTPETRPEPRAAEAAASGSLGATRAASVPTHVAAPMRGPGATLSVPEPSGGGGSRR